MSDPIEGDGLRMARCEQCGGLSLVITSKGQPIAYVCPPNMALMELAKIIVEEICEEAEAKVQAKKSVIHLQ